MSAFRTKLPDGYQPIQISRGNFDGRFFNASCPRNQNIINKSDT
jgi:hypothetical protein